VDDIARCIDARSSYFDWDEEDAFDAFCVAIDPPKPMSQAKQARRHYATLLANVCAGQLDLIAANGSVVRLDEGVEISCDGFGAGTVGELIDEIDDALGHADSTGSGKGYGAILDCVGAVLDGDAVVDADDCGHHDEDDEDEKEEEMGPSLHMSAPSPNPFRTSTRVSFDVMRQEGDRVEVTVYNISGRLVRTLVDRFQGPGGYEVDWDGVDDAGRQVPTGMYFIRAKVGSETSATRRVLFLAQ
jgi:hypothetical protein